ncbi:lipase 3-like [Zerene cesonia]|uniref:lipase 3-like n=1 Tax=Zerene cesonia TaxID=33412 RepID=UPI0018E52044|nr:lipase 3-like [Zerene cesonia]
MYNPLVVFFCFHYIILFPQVFASKQGRILSYSLPESRLLKKAFGYDEDTYLNFTELTQKYDYSSEEHTVTTQDGYNLKVFRIRSKCETAKGYPVILLHGVYDSSDAWILAGPKLGLGYILADNCYDVWAANHRGNTYSRSHVSLNPDTDPEFWNYSFDEHGNFDVPAIIDYVINKTGRPKVYYIGHSQGTTDFFVLGSLRPEYNNKVHLSVHLAPVAWMKYLQSPIPKLLAPQTKLIKTLLDDLGFRELFAKQQILHFILEKLCQIAPEPICGTGLALATGYKHASISPRTIAVAFGHLLVGGSTKTLAHFGQLIYTKKFQRYDEGREGNMIRYGTGKPPDYNLTLVSSPVLLVCGKSDWLSSLADINELSSRLPNLVEEYVVPDPSWSHNNHVWGVNAPKYVFDKILGYFKVYDDMR